MFPLLETKRLILRELTKDDAKDIFSCFSNEQVTRFYGQDTLRNMKQAEDLVEFFANNYKEKRGIRWGIERKEAKGIIGTIGFNAWSTKHKRAEIGYEIHPDYWRHGYASEAVSRIITYGFDSMGLTRIGAVVFPDNTASSTLLTKMGFQKEGVLRNYMYQAGIAYDTDVYALLQECQN
ncbi:GNAT family N-acetyltransferase [Paenibacillus sp. J22TS3]|uniref:GNAT family N-acetyltransferase n=1 Tax=Paenibacillus sp. J22TS3 TaxID=2807192 RepID=UPI001B204328|nr:GNAT family N-acetyltransferase [Paenibacillus sp. J22TS3]GIP23296.1 putative N-acetyltransferase YoaA [Paenibacillus sp. J22TS3]